MSNPLVTVICLCYNHKDFVKPAIQSVLDQNYPNVELIVVDDASTDGSPEIIEQIIAAHPDIKYFPLLKNKGNCKAFNLGLQHAKGDYIIDLAADDILHINRIKEGVNGFEIKGEDYGINFTDAEIIDEKGNYISNFYKINKNKISPEIGEGEVYIDLLNRYFICPPTLMFRKAVFDKLGGYNENLAYEDFDFLLRASKTFKFFYTDKVLVKRRILKSSMSAQQYKKGSKQLRSTFDILKNIKSHNSSKAENYAWRKRVLYEARKTLQIGEIGLTVKYLRLLFNL